MLQYLPLVQRIKLTIGSNAEFNFEFQEDLRPLVESFFRAYPNVISVEHIKEPSSFCRLKHFPKDDSKLQPTYLYDHPLIIFLNNCFNEPFLHPLLPDKIDKSGQLHFY
jgi:hypothetical protein